MSSTAQTHDDLSAYIATFNEEERQELARADAALDLATLLYHARKTRKLTQKLAALRSGVRQQAISRWERSHPNVQLDTLRGYLAALGYNLGLVITDAETGEVVGTAGLPGPVQEAKDEAAPEFEYQMQRLPLATGLALGEPSGNYGYSPFSGEYADRASYDALGLFGSGQNVPSTTLHANTQSFFANPANLATTVQPSYALGSQNVSAATYDLLAGQRAMGYGNSTTEGFRSTARGTQTYDVSQEKQREKQEVA